MSLFDTIADRLSPETHACDPPTSGAALAAHKESGAWYTNLAIVYRLVSEWPDCTAIELWVEASVDERRKLKEPQEIRRRLTGLLHVGLVRQEPERKCRQRGTSMVTWCVTPDAELTEELRVVVRRMRRVTEDSKQMRAAYADPPYFGLASFYDHPEASVYDTLDGHRELFNRLEREFPDGWAYSLHTPSLRQILPLTPEGCRVAAWVKPFASFKPGVNPAYAWEPVIFKGGRKRVEKNERTVRDWVACNITLQRGLVGAKPEGLCFWLFDLLGLQPGDEFVDLFPGSGGVGRAWTRWQRMHDGLFAEATT